MQQSKKKYISWWTIYNDHVRQVVLNNVPDDPEKVSYWRNEVFCKILIFLTPLSLIALVPGVFMSFMNGLPVVGYIDLITFFTVVTITVSPGIKLEIRKALLIFILYCLSVALLYYLPLPGPALLFLLTVTIFSSLIYSSSAAYFSAGTNTVICICFALLIYFGIDSPISSVYNLGSWIAVSSNLVLLSFACAKCLDLLLAGLTASLKVNEISKIKLKKANRLYQFISQINQTIVHVKDAETLFRKSCDISIEFGKYKMAWIGRFDTEQKKIMLLDSSGIAEQDIKSFTDSPYEINGPEAYVLRTGKYFLCNDIEHRLDTESWKLFAEKYNIGSFIVLPIKKLGSIFGTLNLYATQANYFDEDEIALILEVSSDISFALDIFEKAERHKEAELEIRANEARLAEAQSLAKIGNWETDLLNFKVLWSAQTYRIFEGNPDHFDSSQPGFLSYVHADDREKVVEAFNNSFTENSINSIEHRIITKTGEIKFIEEHWQIIHDNDDIPVKAVGTCQDITDRKKSEQENKFKAELLDTIGQAVIATDLNGKVTFWNRAAVEIYGWTLEEAFGESILELTPSMQTQADAEILMKKLLNGESWSGEFYVKRKNGSIFPAFVYNSPVFDEFGKQIGIIGVSNDISERKEHELERSKITNDLLQRNRDLEQFTFMISHNLRAPAANIIGFTEILQEEALSLHEQKEMLHGLALSVSDLDTIIKDINSILQVKLEVNEKKELISFSKLVNDILISYGHLNEKHQIRINADFSEVDEIFSLKVYLHSIFYNLISNSIKYRKPNEHPLIEVKSRKENGKIILIFKDNGLGIDLKTKHDKVFGLYNRFHSHVEGKGMGLFMVKTQVEAIGGKITVASEVNKGTEFTIVFEN